MADGVLPKFLTPGDEEMTWNPFKGGPVRFGKFAFAVLTLILLCSPVIAEADCIGFHAIYPGSFTWLRGNNSLSASSSNVSYQIISGGSSIALSGNILSFVTGAYTGGVGGIYDFASGGSASLTGCTSGCFSGTFTSGQLFFDAAGNTATFVGNFIAGQLDASFLGVADAIGSISVSFANLQPNGNSGLTGDWGSGDLFLTTRVAEPPVLGLLGIGLIFLAALVKRRAKSQTPTTTN